MLSLETKAIRIVNISDYQKISKWQKNSDLVNNVFYVIHSYHIHAFPSLLSRYTSFIYEINVVHGMHAYVNHVWFDDTKWFVLRWLVLYAIAGKEAL